MAVKYTLSKSSKDELDTGFDPLYSGLYYHIAKNYIYLYTGTKRMRDSLIDEFLFLNTRTGKFYWTSNISGYYKCPKGTKVKMAFEQV